MILIKDIMLQQSLRVLEDIENKRPIAFDRCISLQSVLICLLFFNEVHVIKTKNRIPVEESIDFYNSYFKAVDYHNKRTVSESLEKQALDFFFEFSKPEKTEPTADENGLYNSTEALSIMFGKNGYYDINRNAKQAIDYWLLSVEGNINYCASLVDSTSMIAFQWKQFIKEIIEIYKMKEMQDEKQIITLSPIIKIPDFVDYLSGDSLPKEELIKRVLVHRYSPSVILLKKQLNSIIDYIDRKKFNDAIESITALPERFDSLCKTLKIHKTLMYTVSFYPTVNECAKSYKLVFMPYIPAESKELKRFFPIDERYFSSRESMQLY